MVHALVKSLGDGRVVVVVYAFHSALKQGLGGAKPEAMSGAYFALGVIKPGHGHATASTMHPASRMAKNGAR